jgi:hypothetical protein
MAGDVLKFKFWILIVFAVGCASQPEHPLVTKNQEAATRAAYETGSATGLVSHWLSWGPDSTLSARAVVTTDKCPVLETNNGSFPMSPRAPADADFPFLICEAKLPHSKLRALTKAEVLGQAFKIPKKEIKRVVIFGDTGCRLMDGKKGRPGAYQACNDANDWPLKTLTEAAAALQPDLVIHVGDYHYREAPCPPNNVGCKGSPYGLGWNVWSEDFFKPAKKLLETAPWIFTRGNHEACARAGEGWNKLLAARSSPTCVESEDPFAVRFGNQEIVVVDAAEENTMQPSFEKVPSLKKGFRWLLLHRPFLTDNSTPGAPSLQLLPQKLRKPGQISLVMAGHVHTLSLNRFSDHRPPEFIIGSGGSALDHDPTFLKKGPEDDFYEYKDFGFVSLDKMNDNNWHLTVHDRFGKVIKECEIKQAFRQKTAVECP